jgi:hypothetical protein
VHPHKPIVAIAGAEGFVLFWDFIDRVTMPNQNYELYKKDGASDSKGPVHTCMVFTPDGEELIIGHGSHSNTLALMDPNTG